MNDEPLRVSFLLVSGFMMAAYVLAADALRLANWRDGRRLFRWDVRTPDDRPAEANNGMIVAPDVSLETRPAPDAVFISAGFSPEVGCTKSVFKWLRALERQRAILGGWDTGPLILAEAGLMDDRRMALHWQAVPAVQERYPRVEIISDECQIENRRFTGPGGVSTFDLMIAFIDQMAGPQVAQMVTKSANRNIPAIEDAGTPFASSGAGSAKPQPHIKRVIATMEKEIEKPQSIPAIAERCGLSERALYRIFREHMGVTPTAFYLTLRLQRARDLLRQSDMPIAEIAAAAGFSSASRFSQVFRQFFGMSPRSARKHPRWLQMGHATPILKRYVRTDP